jgi:hypothetical protein
MKWSCHHTLSCQWESEGWKPYKIGKQTRATTAKRTRLVTDKNVNEILIWLGYFCTTHENNFYSSINDDALTKGESSTRFFNKFQGKNERSTEVPWTKASEHEARVPFQMCFKQAGLAISFGRLNFCWPLPAQSFLASGLVEIYDQVFCSLLDRYVFGSGASPSMRGGVGVSV